MQKLDENESGFVPGSSGLDNFFIVQQLVEKHINHKDKLSLAFVDLEKAYDSVLHSSLWKFMAVMEINGKVLKIL